MPCPGRGPVPFPLPRRIAGGRPGRGGASLHGRVSPWLHRNRGGGQALCPASRRAPAHCRPRPGMPRGSPRPRGTGGVAVREAGKPSGPGPGVARTVPGSATPAASAPVTASGSCFPPRRASNLPFRGTARTGPGWLPGVGPASPGSRPAYVDPPRWTRPDFSRNAGVARRTLSPCLAVRPPGVGGFPWGAPGGLSRGCGGVCRPWRRRCAPRSGPGGAGKGAPFRGVAPSSRRPGPGPGVGGAVALRVPGATRGDWPGRLWPAAFPRCGPGSRPAGEGPGARRGKAVPAAFGATWARTVAFARIS